MKPDHTPSQTPSQTLPLFAIFLVTFFGLAGQKAHASSDIRHGADVFETQCAECHSAKPGRNKKGPSLFGVVGRPAASVADYAYSEAMRANAQTWTPERLDAYLVYPRKVVPGTKMKFDGLDDTRDRADLIAFLTAEH